jgi:hypothetical protein
MIQGQPRCGKPRRGLLIYDQASINPLLFVVGKLSMGIS